MTDTRLLAPRLTVTYPHGGTTRTETVQTSNADLVRWDMTRAKRGWPDVEAAVFLWQTFLAWSALQRTKPTVVPTLDVFLDTCEAVTMVDADGDPTDDVDATAARPTVPDHVSG